MTSPNYLSASQKKNSYDAIVIAVAHDQFKELGIAGIKKLTKDKSAIFDVKHIFNSKEVDGIL